MVKREDIVRVLETILQEDNIIGKCSTTVGEMHNILSKLPGNVKEYLVKSSLTENQYNKYHDSEDEDEVFDYERQIFDNYTPSMIDTILHNKSFLENVDFNNLTSTQAETVLLFDKKKYPHDSTRYSMTKDSPPGELEQVQLDYERPVHSKFKEEISSAVVTWTHGGYRSVQEIRLGIFDEPGNAYIKGQGYVDQCKNANRYLEEGIQSSKGLVADNMLYRKGHFDTGMKPGETGDFPCFSSTSYSAGAANSLGEGYAMHIYAPKGTKGMMIDTDYFGSDGFPEHEFLLGPDQKFIVLNVNDSHKTAEILLI